MKAEDAGRPQISVDYKIQHREQTAHRAKTSVKEKEKSTSEAKLRLEFKPVSTPGIKLWKIFKFSLFGLFTNKGDECGPETSLE